MVQVYSAAAVHAALPWDRLARALETAFVAGAQVPVRHVHPLSERDVMLLMPAWDDRLIVTKLVTAIPGAPSTVCATVLAVDRATGEPLAVLDGEAVTLRRTAAASALAATRLARADASELLVVGSGRLAGWVARAHAALLPSLQRVRVWGRRLAPAQALADTLAAEGLPAQAVAPDGLEAAVRAADVVSCVTTAADPVVFGRWLKAGTHLDLVGGFRPDMREVDDEAVARARIVVDTHAGALAEAGDLVQPLRRGVIAPQAIAGDLAELLRGHCAGRRDGHEITLFKSVGTALEDLAATRLVLGAQLGDAPPRPD
ncbi:MAG: ornithine cyclodeaminase family protein [Rubrivivax sp.]